jgi:UDP-galactopyranose mutase
MNVALKNGHAFTTTQGASGRIAVVGAGISGAVVARELAEHGFQVDVFDARSHIAGNCHTERDEITDVMVHVYGPHLFHTSRARVWSYVQKFAKWEHLEHRVKATTASGVYSMPINLHTLNQFFGAKMDSLDAKSFVESLQVRGDETPLDFETQGLRMVGVKLYDEFFRGYTQKQWGCSPIELPASILKRLPLRFDYNDRYFSDRFEAAPVGGYTQLVSRILSHHRISVHVGAAVGSSDVKRFKHVFWSGELDAYFDRCDGALGYRTLDFKRETHNADPQGCSVMNYCQIEVPHTRISEHSKFSPWESPTGAVTLTEYSREWKPGDIPYYPVRLAAEQQLLKRYVELASEETDVTFLGRLGTYRYLDMDASIEEALEVADSFIATQQMGNRAKAFVHQPV